MSRTYCSLAYIRHSVARHQEEAIISSGGLNITPVPKTRNGRHCARCLPSTLVVSQNFGVRHKWNCQSRAYWPPHFWGAVDGPIGLSGGSFANRSKMERTSSIGALPMAPPATCSGVHIQLRAGSWRMDHSGNNRASISPDQRLTTSTCRSSRKMRENAEVTTLRGPSSICMNRSSRQIRAPVMASR